MRSFGARITFRFAALVTATSALVLGGVGWLLSIEAVKGLDLLNQAEFVEIRDRLGEPPPAWTAKEVDRRVRLHTRIDAALYFFQIHDSSGRLLFRSTNLGPIVLPDLSGGPLERTVNLEGVGEARLCEYYYGSLHIQIASLLTPAYRLLHEYVRISLLLLGGVALASIALGWGFARITLRPIRAIHDTAACIGADNLGERIVVPPGRDELSDLARLLNRMFDGLESSFSQVKRFTADASHELKTPLALMRLNAEKLRRRVPPDSEVGAGIDEILEQIEQLRRIIESLLFLAKVEAGTFCLQTKPVDPAEFVRDFTEDASALAEEAGVLFGAGHSAPGLVHCEPTLVRQLLLNLVSNSLRVSAPGAKIELRSELVDGQWRLTVSDEGPGLPPGELERVFERFVRYRSEGEAGGPDYGHGLGLAICRSIVGLHGGSISLENRDDRPGLRARVVLQAQLPGPMNKDSSDSHRTFISIR